MVSMILNLNYGFLYYVLRQKLMYATLNIRGDDVSYLSVQWEIRFPNQPKERFWLSNFFITLTDNYESLDVWFHVDF